MIFKLLIDYFSGLRLLSASRLIASSRLPPNFSDKANSSIFSVSSVVYVKYSSKLTSVAYTADCVPPKPIQTSLYFRLGWLARLMESTCERSLSVSPKRFCMLSNLFRYFRWSSSILQSELFIILSFTMDRKSTRLNSSHSV